MHAVLIEMSLVEALPVSPYIEHLLAWKVHKQFILTHPRVVLSLIRKFVILNI